MILQEYLKTIDYYKFVPTNLVEEKTKFLNYCHYGCRYNPQFTYAPEVLKLPPSVDLEQLIKTEDSLLKQDFIVLYTKVAQLYTATTQQDYSAITVLSGELFGSYTSLRFPEAVKLYSKLCELSSDYSRLAGKQLITRFKMILEMLKFKNWKVQIASGKVGEVSIYEDKKLIEISDSATFTESDIERLIYHEIYAHAIQTRNAQSNINNVLLTSYIGTETQYEGLAVISEFQYSRKEFVKDTIQRYLGLMIATFLATEFSFCDVYDFLFKINKDSEYSFNAALKAKRGFVDTSQKGAFQKENSYLTGAMQILQKMENQKNILFKLFEGNFPLNSL